jgi:hypothetical protein
MYRVVLTDGIEGRMGARTFPPVMAVGDEGERQERHTQRR